MAEERVDRARKMVRRINLVSRSKGKEWFAFAFHPLFFQHFDGPYFPTLRLQVLHKCKWIQFITALADHTNLFLFGTLALADPFILPHVRIDRGAIRFLLAGAHMMCPGLMSAGGWLPPADAALPASTPVAFDAEGKESAVKIGLTKLGTEEMKKVNKGIVVESITYVGDDR